MALSAAEMSIFGESVNSLDNDLAATSTAIAQPSVMICATFWECVAETAIPLKDWH